MATKNGFTQNKNLQYIIMGRKYDDQALFKIVFKRLHIRWDPDSMVFGSQSVALKCVRNLDGPGWAESYWAEYIVPHRNLLLIYSDRTF